MVINQRTQRQRSEAVVARNCGSNGCIITIIICIFNDYSKYAVLLRTTTTDVIQDGNIGNNDGNNYDNDNTSVVLSLSRRF